MDLGKDIFPFVLALGIVQGLILAGAVYLHPKADKSVNSFLAIFLFSLSILLTLPLAVHSIPWQESYVHQPVPLLVGPSLYLYIKSFTEKITWRKALPHYLIFVLFFVPAWWNIKTLAELYPGHETVPAGVLRHPVSIALTCIKLIQPIFYFILSRRILTNYQRSIKHVFSDITRIHLNWTWVLVNGFVVMIAISLAMYATVLVYPEYFTLLFSAAFVLGTPYIYFITYKGTTQSTLWQVLGDRPGKNVEVQIHEAEEIELQISHPEKVSTQRPAAGLPDEKMQQLITRINDLLEKDKIYLEPELTVQNLAGMLEIPSYQVSLVINDGLQKNFYDLINGFRVEEAKRLLTDPKAVNYKMATVGSESGFNSKTTFNTVFKKFTGFTPSEYRDRQKQEISVPELH